MASVLIVQALLKGQCGANQIACTDTGSADKLSEQDLDLRNTANKTLPSWLLSEPTAHALKHLLVLTPSYFYLVLCAPLA